MRQIVFILLSPIFLVTTYLSAQTIGISEFMYHADTSAHSNDWVELYNYGNSPVNISGWKLKDENIDNTFIIPTSTTIDPGAYLVIAQSLDTFLMVYPDVTNVIGSFDFGFGNKSDQVRLLDASNTPIVEINYIDSLPWPSAADGMGPSLQIKSFDDDPNNPDNWFAGCVRGTPGTAYFPCDYPLVVSEINYNSAPFFKVGDWIELYNRSGAAIDLTGWQFRDQQDNIFEFPSGIILEDGERLVVSDSLDAITTAFPGLDNMIGEFTFSLSNGGDAVLLYDAAFTLQFSVKYNDKLPWPIDADGDGYTLEFVEENDNPNIPENWIAGCPFGSPGIPFTFPCPTLQAENININSIEIYPNPFADYLYLDLSELNVGIIQQCYITDLYGRIITDIPVDNSIVKWNNTLASGIYLLHLIASDGTQYTQKIMRN